MMRHASVKTSHQRVWFPANVVTWPSVLFCQGHVLLRQGSAPPRATLNALHEKLEKAAVVRVTVVSTQFSLTGV